MKSISWIVIALLFVLLVFWLVLFGRASFSMQQQAATLKQQDSNWVISKGPIYTKGKYTEGQIRFFSSPDTMRLVRLFPNRALRQQRNIKHLANVSGVAHFFMDHDPSSGYVHPFTLNFYKKLRPHDFVMKLIPTNQSGVVAVKFIEKQAVKLNDTLAKQTAFFRQWRLDELDCKDNKIRLRKAHFNPFYCCPQLKASCNNPFKTELPILIAHQPEGYIPIAELNQLTDKEGGTVFIVWKLEEKIWFKDVHGSLADIMNAAQEIKEKYGCIPSIVQGDAGPFSQKHLSDRMNVLHLDWVDGIEPGCGYCGAGFGYYIPAK